MTQDFNDDFTFAPSPLQDDALRTRLQQAILDDDAEQFRAILQEAAPQLAGVERFYGVLIPTADGMQTILVDHTGRRLGSDDILDTTSPIDMLNVHYGSTEMTVTFENQKWSRPYTQS
jgi:hypothetical protein